MKLFTFIMISSMVLLGACKGEENVQMVVDNCDRLIDVKVLTQQEREMTCIYNDVYRLNGKIYTVCVCCVCDKLAMAVDCNGENLCDFTEGCMRTFFEDAEYLFSVEGEL